MVAEVKILETPRMEKGKRIAEDIRKYAEMAENGEISNIVCVALTTDNDVLTYTNFESRLSLAGALHYAMLAMNEE